jgi:hypothetical protein
LQKFLEINRPVKIALQKNNIENSLVISMTSKKRVKNSHLVFLPVLAVLMLAGCQKPTINFGQTFITGDPTNVIVIDTITPLISTIILDSFPTAASGTLLIGRYQDSAFGVVTCKTILQVGPPTSVPSISNVAIYDSISLILRANKSFYGDTTHLQRYIVSQLESVIQLPGIQTTFYNTSNFIPVDSAAPLGFTDAVVSPGRPFTSQLNLDSLKIKLSDAQGQQLFQMLRDQSDTIKNAAIFYAYFKGLCIYPDNNSLGAVYGFKDSIIMRLYYHEPEVVQTGKFIDFHMSNKSFQFNNIVANRSNTILSVLDSLLATNINAFSATVPSSRTNFASYIQSGTGIETKIQFPYLTQITALPDYLSVLRADLVIKPVMGTYSPTNYLPSSLFLYQTDQNNIPGLPLAGNGSLIVDYLYGVNTAYVYDVTNYIKQQISLGQLANSNNGLILTIPPPGNDTTMARVIIGDRINPKTNIQLKLYYASFH